MEAYNRVARFRKNCVEPTSTLLGCFWKPDLSYYNKEAMVFDIYRMVI